MAKYLNINRQVCLDTWQGMLRPSESLISSMSFPDFTRHLFLSLTETVDNLAKGILNQWTPAAQAYCLFLHLFPGQAIPSIKKSRK